MLWLNGVLISALAREILRGTWQIIVVCPTTNVCTKAAVSSDRIFCMDVDTKSMPVVIIYVSYKTTHDSIVQRAVAEYRGA